eukprot:3033319-Prymnesium_polylepis.1
MLVILERLAKKFADVKFLQIHFTDCIPNYPEKNLPTMLVYRDDDLLQQLVGLSVYGGSSYGIDGVGAAHPRPVSGAPGVCVLVSLSYPSLDLC